MYRWSAAPAPAPRVPLPSTYLPVRRPEFINATLNYAAHLSPQLRGPGTEAAVKARPSITACCSSLLRAPSPGGLGHEEGRGSEPLCTHGHLEEWRGLLAGATGPAGPEKWEKGRSAPDASFSKILHLVLCLGSGFSGKCVESIPYFLLGPEQLPGRGGSIRACRASFSRRSLLLSSLGLDHPASPLLKAKAAAVRTRRPAAPSPEAD